MNVSQSHFIANESIKDHAHLRSGQDVSYHSQGASWNTPPSCKNHLATTT